MHRKIFAFNLFLGVWFLDAKYLSFTYIFNAGTLLVAFLGIDWVYIIHFLGFLVVSERFCAHWALKLMVV